MNNTLLTQNDIDNIFVIFEKNNPNPKIELNYNNIFTLLVAVLLSAQTTDKSVNIATKELFETYNTPEKMFLLGSSELEERIKKIGLYRTKAKHIIELSNILITKYNGNVPDNFDDLISLPGVGRKTADVVLNSAFNQPKIAVDCHIYRISNRIGLVSNKNINDVADNLLKNIPQKWHKNAHYWLVLHGRYICVAKKPKCDICPIFKICLKKIKQ